MDEFAPTEPVETSHVAVVRPPSAARMARVGIVGAAAAALVAVGILIAAASGSPSGILAAGNASSSPSASGGAANPGGVPGDHDFGRGGPGFGHGGPGFRAITVQSIDGSSLSLGTDDGWTRTIAVDSGTTFSRDGTSIALSDIKVGDEIRFQETRESDGSYSIDAVAVIPPHVAGTVSAVSGSTITLTQRDGTTATVSVTGSTTYDVAGNASATLSDIKTGMVLNAEGTKASDGSLTATSVRAGTAGFGHGGGHGPDGDNDGDGPNAGSGGAAAPSASSSTSTQ